MKFIDSRAFSDPEVAAKKLMEIANGIEPVQDGRTFIELINWPFLHDLKGSPAEYKAGLDLCIERGWLWKHESGTYVKLPQAGADFFAQHLAVQKDELYAARDFPSPEGLGVKKAARLTSSLRSRRSRERLPLGSGIQNHMTLRSVPASASPDVFG